MYQNDDPREAYKYFWDHIASNMGASPFSNNPFADAQSPFFSFQQSCMKKFMETQLIMLKEYQKHAEKHAANQAFDEAMRENFNSFIKAGMGAYLEMKKAARKNRMTFTQMQAEMLGEYMRLLEQTVENMDAQERQEPMPDQTPPHSQQKDQQKE